MQSLFVTGTHKRASDVLHDARVSIANALGALAPRAGLRGALSPGVPLATGGRCTAYPYAFLDRDRWPDTFILLSAAEGRARPSISTVDFETRSFRAPRGTSSIFSRWQMRSARASVVRSASHGAPR